MHFGLAPVPPEAELFDGVCDPGCLPQSATRQANDHKQLLPMTAFGSEKASGQTCDGLPGDGAATMSGSAAAAIFARNG